MVEKAEKAKEKFNRFWKVLNGNKTIIGSNVISILIVCPIPEPYKTISISVTGLLTGIAFKQHIDKGFFKVDKGH